MRIPVDVAPLTITLNEQKACNPLESVAVYVTVREPKEKESPESKLEVNIASPLLSVAIGSIQDTVTVEAPTGSVAN